MTQLPRRQIGAALAKKGFTLADERDHDVYFLVVGGKKTGIFTKLSRGAKYREIQDGLLGKMATQLGLSKAEFVDFVDCHLDEEKLLTLLRERKAI